MILESERWNENDKEKGQREFRMTVAKLGLENWEIMLETAVAVFSGNAEFVFGYFKRVKE